MEASVDSFNSKRRVVITGIGVHNSIGKNKEEVYKNILINKCGIKNIEKFRFDVSNDSYVSKKAYLINDDDFLELQKKDDSIVVELSKQVIQEAIKDSGLKESDIEGYNCGLALGISGGTSFSFIKWLQKKLDNKLTQKDLSLILRSTPSIAGELANFFRLKGVQTTISTACASGTISIGTAYEKIANNEIDYMIAGGVDIVTMLSFSGFNSLHNMSDDICTPFDINRKGLALGEGAGFVVLESYENAKKRNAEIYAEISGYYFLNEAYHATSPQEEGDYAFYCMEKALINAEKDVNNLSYINAHGTATNINDMMEAKAIKRLVKNNKVYVSSSKSFIGHTLGAAGSIECIITALGIKNSFIPPNINTKEHLFENTNILLQKETINYKIDVALSNSFGFGGNMASIVLNRV